MRTKSKYRRLNEKQYCYLIEILEEEHQFQIKYYNGIVENYFGVKRWVPLLIDGKSIFKKI